VARKPGALEAHVPRKAKQLGVDVCRKEQPPAVQAAGVAPPGVRQPEAQRAHPGTRGAGGAADHPGVRVAGAQRTGS
jgi:hypothetical protein